MSIEQHEIKYNCPYCNKEIKSYFIFGTRQFLKVECIKCGKIFYVEVHRFKVLKIAEENIIPEEKSCYSYGN